MDLVLIAAVARNRVIGHDNGLLWSLPEDMKHFRAATMGAPVIMGRKTWQSLPERFRPLPGRNNIVLSREPGFVAPGASVVANVNDAIALAAQGGARRAFIIGGEQVYRTALPLASELLLTEIERDYDGDARFPAFAPAHFAEVARERHHAAPPNDFDFSFVTYRRRVGGPPAG
jgi:dihydrofolate reductase